MAGEQAFIEVLKAIATDKAARGLTDDTAVLKISGTSLVLTHDILVEGVHFLPGTDPQDVAWKLVATNMSDLAAKGAKPLGVMLGYILRDDHWDAAFAKGLGDALAHYNAPLLGGDTVGASRADMVRSFGLTAIGEAPLGGAPSRSGAKAGDMLYLCGNIGDAMLGFEAISAGQAAADTALTRSYLRPKALLAEGQRIAPIANAMMDVSDGLLLDAYRMAQASGVTLHIDSGKVPVSKAAQHIMSGLSADSAKDKFQAMLRWGDDYALLFAAPADAKVADDAKIIGRIGAYDKAPLIMDGEMIASSADLGYQH